MHHMSSRSTDRDHRHSEFRRSSPLLADYGSLPFFGDAFSPDDLYSSGYPVASPLPPFLMQAVQSLAGSANNPMQQAAAQPRPDPSSNQPLMIELQNGKYVRVDNSAANAEATPLEWSAGAEQARASAVRALLPSNLRKSSATSAPSATSAISESLPPALLIFRDGHSEEVRDYTIANGTLYARGNFYIDGYWTKTIDLTALDVPGTLQANAARNVKFALPSSPNEVITRP
jgi:hypothetical protein